MKRLQCNFPIPNWAAAALVTGALLCATGCLSYHSGVTESVVPFKVGETSFETVLGTWGNPTHVKKDVYSWEEADGIGSKLKASYYGVGLTFERNHRASKTHRLTFDKRGILRTIKTDESMPSGPTWKFWPW